MIGSARVNGTRARGVALGVVIAIGGPAAAAHAATPGLVSGVLKGSADRGAIAASTPRDVTFVLKSRDVAGLKQFVASKGHASLSPAQFRARFGPSSAALTAVRAWAKTSGLKVASVSPNGSVVRVTGSAGTLGRSLGVSFHRFVPATGSSYVASTTTAKLPAKVANVTTAVLGLSDAGKVSLPQHAKPAAGGSSLGLPTTYGPKELAALYGAGSSSTGSGQSVSIITEGDLTVPRADLVKFEDTFGLPHVTWDQIDVGAASTDTAGSDEWDLDSQYSTGLAPGVSALHVYNGTSLSNDDILATINRWVSDKKSVQASFSAGECEALAAVTGFTDGLDAILAQAAAQGQTLFTSSGDTGSQCPLPVVGVNGVPAGLPGTNYPASSPGAITVGGTTVLGGTEIAWYAGGGGTSLFEGVPAFQVNAGGSFTGLARGVPDVSLDADPNSGYEVIVGGTQETIGGTSASAPAWQGIWARAQAAHGGTLGFAGPALYGAPASAFNDITVGTNGIFPATPGWDYDTGRGTPNITALVNGL